MTDQEIVTALIEHDPQVTARFFYKDCCPLFLSVIRKVFDGRVVDYDEIISELYILLMEDDARRLRQFKFTSTLYQWFKVLCIRHCLRLKAADKVIGEESKEPFDHSDKNQESVKSSQAKMDVEALLGKKRNQRYAKVLRMLMIDDMSPDEVAKELSVTIDNLYNIKRRAMVALTNVALKDKTHYDR